MPYKDAVKQAEYLSRYHKAWYQHNKPAIRASRRKSTALLRGRLAARNADLKSGPCMDCGRTFPPCAMDWDHRDPGIKRMTITQMVSAGLGFDTIMAEINKCDLVCAVCHRIRTHMTRKRSISQR